ncbi:MAG: aldo/keto reductase [Archaeoglobaceae archaeon]
MEYTNIAGTDIIVSRIGLGSQPIGYHEKRSGIETVHKALEEGITLIDVAPVYGKGRSEEIVGDALKEYDREEFVVATKTGLDYENDTVRNGTPKRILKDIETSLKRLNTDYVDVLHVHWPDPLHPLRDTARTIKDLQREGKVRAIGVSNFSVEQIEEFSGETEVNTCQMPYNIFERKYEDDVLPFCKKNNITFLAYRSLCQGLLTGKLLPDAEYSEHSVKKDDPKFRPSRYQQYLEAVEKLSRMAEEHNRKLIDVAIQWILDNKNSVALWGAWKPEYLNEVNDVLGQKLDPSIREDIDRILEETIKDPVGPEFLEPPTRDFAQIGSREET